jgi:hypothetical protein
MVFQSLVYGMEQTCRLKNAKCIKSTWLQKSQSILWLIITRSMSILTYDWRSHHPATQIMSLCCHDRRSHYPATRITSLYRHMTGEVIIQLPGSCLYTVIWQKSSSSYPDNVSMLSYDRWSHHPATRIMSLYCHMTGEVITQLPGSCLYTVIWQKLSSSYPDNVSMLSYDRRSHHPATWIMSLFCHDRRSHHPATRILALYCHMTGEVIIQLSGY